MLQSIHNFHIYQALVARFIAERKDLILIRDEHEDFIASMAKKREDIKRRHIEVSSQINKTITQSRRFYKKS